MWTIEDDGSLKLYTHKECLMYDGIYDYKFISIMCFEGYKTFKCLMKISFKFTNSKQWEQFFSKKQYIFTKNITLLFVYMFKPFYSAA